MSQIGRWSGVVLMTAGVGLGAYTAKGVAEARASVEARGRAAEAASAEVAGRREAEERTVATRVEQAAAIKPLNSAVGDHIDGTTLIDLFDHEDWWLPFRDEAGARVIVGDLLVGTWGRVDFGTTDASIVRAARKHRVASGRVEIRGIEYVLGAARLSALPEREPVLVLAHRAQVAALAPAAELAVPTLAQKSLPLGAAGGLVVVGLVLVVARGRRKAQGGAQGGAVIAAEVPREPTLRFGTPARPLPAPDLQGQVATASDRAPMVNGAGVSIRGSASRQASPPSVASLPTVSGAPSAPLPRMDSGRTFGRYRLLDRLGEGGMSEVFTAVANGAEGFSRTFVLKRLRPELAREREAVAQFIDEARLQATLVHSNIVPVFDFGMIGNGEYFMTQEYIVGRDLLRLMMRHQEHSAGGIEPRLCYYLAHETLQALAFAHEHRDKDGAPMELVHRDVSPGNIMISLRGEVKLADFGIVKASRRVSRTQVGMVKGNANFMSPEQARGQAVDLRSDLFSMATVMFYCLTGELLYGGENDLDVLYKAARGPTDEDLARIAALPDPAASILAKALSVDPAERFQSAGEFADQLAAFTGGGKTQAANLVQLLFGDELRRQAA
jgi:serine/threonine-protein kinase